jgi:thiol-disulfide isomerase/thioredoxin
MKNTPSKFLLIPLMLLISSVACTPAGEPAGEIVALEVLPVKAVEIPQIISDFTDKKAVIVNVWATWCIPCVEEFPYLVQLRNEFKDQLEVVFISADFPEEMERIHTFLTENGVNWQTYLKDDRDEPFIDAVAVEWSGAIPATAVYNTSGERIHFMERAATYDEFRTLALSAITNP